MKVLSTIVFGCFLYLHSFSQVDIETRNEINAGLFKTNGIWSGGLLQLNSSGENYILLRHYGNFSASLGFNHFSNRSFLIKNYNTGSSDLITFEGGNGGKFWMYPDGKLYANNLGDIVNQSPLREMRWNSTTGEIGWTSSSARFKTDILPWAADWKKILKATPVTYTRPTGGDEREIGYIAEDLQALGLSPLVGLDRQGLPEYIHYDKIVFYLLEVIKIHEQELVEVKDQLRRLSIGKKRGKKEKD